MKVLKIIGIILGLFLAFWLISGLFISKDYHMEKEVVINAPREKVWGYTNSLQQTDKWNPFKDGDPNIQVSYEGQPGAIGSKYKWKGNKEVGSGEQTITGVEPLSAMRSHLHFIEPFEGNADAYVQLSDAGGGTKVTWGFNSETPYLFRPMHLFMNMDKMMGDMYDTGLARLKKLAESN